jgi:23S rRNA (guanosine2251-2'-O)-methyltransferase
MRKGIISRANPILEALNVPCCRVEKLLIQKDSRKEKIEEVLTAAGKRRIPCSFVSKKILDGIDRHHQGLVAFVAEKKTVSLVEIISSSPCPFLLLLDGIEDPQNLGAVIRTAEAAGADGIVLPERRAAGLTEAVARVSAGAVEHIKIARVKNLVHAMGRLRQEEIWIVGAEGGRTRNWYEFDFTLPVGIVLGSEAKGLRPLVRKQCDDILSLPLLGQISSLNVAAAAAVFLYEVVRQRKRKKIE